MEFVKYYTENRIAYIVLARAEKRNALNYQVVAELKEAFEKAKNDIEAKVIVLKAEGKVFCAGADLAYMQELQKNTFEENLQDSTHLAELFEQIYTHPKVVIAQIHGHAIAGGAGLATVCDFSFAVPEASFGYTEVKIGFIPAIVMFFLLRKIGEGRAKELLLSGSLITAQKAQEFGLVNYLVEENSLEEEVEKFALGLCESNSAQSMASTKQMIAQIQTMTTKDALSFAAYQNAHTRQSSDCQKGIAHFLEKKNLVW
ncbi:MAG: enoyl-CoA hydratase-related protein [Thermonemataceae bacterium]|nr:enoyl-CoA hydratase-related protein [Thermonemataceae bacterium]